MDSLHLLGHVQRLQALAQAGLTYATDPYDREHVTPFVYRQPERYRLANLVCPFGNYSHVNLSVDTTDDYERALSVHRRLPEPYDYRDILNVIELERL